MTPWTPPPKRRVSVAAAGLAALGFATFTDVGQAQTGADFREHNAYLTDWQAKVVIYRARGAWCADVVRMIAEARADLGGVDLTLDDLDAIARQAMQAGQAACPGARDGVLEFIGGGGASLFYRTRAPGDFSSVRQVSPSQAAAAAPPLPPPPAVAAPRPQPAASPPPPPAPPRSTASTTPGRPNVDTTRLEGIPAAGKQTWQLRAAMTNVDDVGYVYVLPDAMPQGGVRPALSCMWAPMLPGNGSVNLDGLIPTGRSTILFALFDRQVVGTMSLFTGGKYAFGFSLSDKDGVLWSQEGYGASSGPGVKYMRAISVTRDRNGAIRVMRDVHALDAFWLQLEAANQLESNAARSGITNTTLSDGRSGCS